MNNNVMQFQESAFDWWAELDSDKKIELLEMNFNGIEYDEYLWKIEEIYAKEHNIQIE